MKKLTTTEILNKIDSRVQHIKKLDVIRAERRKLNTSPSITNMKDEKKTGEKSQ